MVASANGAISVDCRGRSSALDANYNDTAAAASRKKASERGGT